MAAIPKRIGEGGAHLMKGNGTPDLLTILEDIADDLAAIKAASPALASVQEATADANTQTGAYVQADVQSIRTLANSLKAKYNTLQADVAAMRTALTGFTIKTTKSAGV